MNRLYITNRDHRIVLKGGVPLVYDLADRDKANAAAWLLDRCRARNGSAGRVA